ncbi:MAG: peptidoglycan DD-metalloendopeptidase family protein [Clostridia bacterium]|nr:peptidoglycan DD-metalloendopeptidase family protein [Clostridia bacterium]
MDEEEKKLNTEQNGQGDGEITAAGAAEPVNAHNADDIFASLLDADRIAADFDRINFEIFGEPEREFAPEPADEPEAGAQAEIPVEQVSQTAEETSANKSGGRKTAKSINTGDLVINVTEKQQKKADREKAKQKLKEKKLREKQRKKERSPYGDMSLTQMLHELVYTFGYSVIRYSKALFFFFAASVAKPFVIFFKALGVGKKKKEKRTFRRRLADLIDEYSRLREDSKTARQAIKRVWRDPDRLRKALKLYFSHIKKNYLHFLKTAGNILLPAAACVFLFLSTRYWKDLTFALDVTYNDISLGCIGEESVYMEAQNLIAEKLDTGAYSFDGGEADLEGINASLDAQYKLRLVSLNELNDAETICDRVIENSADNLTNACGIYIDGEFMGAVKNEADAKTVFHNYLLPYLDDAEKEGYVVGFAEDVEYRQGIYSDTEKIIIDPQTLDKKIHGRKTVTNEYKMQQYDTLEHLAILSGVPQERLVELNPDYDWENVREGDKITYEKETNVLRIQKTIISSETVDVPFDTIISKDNTKYAGYSNVTRKGVNGKNRVTTTKIYIEDVLSDVRTQVDVITTPIPEVKTVGGMSYYGAIVIGTTSSSGFLWPAPSCNYISSSYGYRSSGFHDGVDLCRADGGAIGTSVVASRDGWVEYAGWNSRGYGYMVLINHGDGYKTRYGHMLSGSICVSPGDYVYAGQQLGRVGSTGNSTGPHLHFEVIYYGEKKNPMNYLSR